MKKVYGCIFMFVALLTQSCGNSQAIPASTQTPLSTNTPAPTLSVPTLTTVPTLTRIETAENWPGLDFLPEHPFFSIYKISPNGEWMFYDKARSGNTTTIRLASLTEKIFISTEYITPDILLEDTPYYFSSWSPDGSAFAGTFGAWPKGGCCADTIAISTIVDGKIQSLFYKWGETDMPYGMYPHISWSDDSSKIGLYFPNDGFRILDRKGNLIDKLAMDLGSFIWVNDSLFTATYADKKWTLSLVDIKKRTTEALSKSNEFGNNISIAIIGYDVKTNQLILLRKAGCCLTQEILFFDVKTHRLNGDPIHISWYFSMSKPVRYVAWTENNGLWILDLEKKTNEYYGQVRGSGRWFSTFEGFLVETQEGNYKIIKP